MEYSDFCVFFSSPSQLLYVEASRIIGGYDGCLYFLICSDGFSFWLLAGERIGKALADLFSQGNNLF